MNASARALRYLLARSYANGARTQWRRIRTPRYAIGFVIGLLYMSWLLVGRTGRSASGLPGGTTGVGPMLYEALLAVTTGWTWLFGDAEPALNFTAAEVQMLFPAPVSRRALVRYKLAQMQLPTVLTALLWLLLLPRTSLAIGSLHALALWVLLTTLSLHRVGASLVRVAAAQHGRTGLRRNAIALGIAAAAIGAAAWGVARAFPALQAAMQDGTLGNALLALRREPVIRVVLWPFHTLVAPVFASTPGEWLSSIDWGVALLVFNYVWVVRSGVGFEEAAMRRSERVAALRASRSARGLTKVRASRGWLPLRPIGRPEIALAWKNALAFQRLLQFSRLAVIAFGVIAVTVTVVPGEGRWTSVGRAAALGFAGLFVLFGPLYVRTDLHMDMLKLPLLRSYPLSGAAIVGAEIGGSVAILSALQLVLLVIGSPTLVQLTGGRHLLPIAIAGLFTLPAITALRVAVANAWVVLLPAWVPLGPTRAGGIEALGQNMLAIVGSLIAHLFLLLAPAIAAVVVWAVAAPWMGAWAFVLGAIVGAAVALAELWGLVRWLGGVLARADPAAVEAAATT